MALSSKEEATLKEVAIREDKDKAIQIIIKEATTKISAKSKEIEVIQDKRDADIKTLRNA